MAHKKTKNQGFASVLFAILIVILIIIVGIIVLCVSAFQPNRKQTDLTSYLSKVFTTYDNDAYGTIIQGSSVVADTPAYFANNQAYLPLSYAQGLNERIYQDISDHSIRYSLPNRTIILPANSCDYYNGIETVNAAAPLVIYDAEADATYIAASFVAEHTDLVYETYSDPNRIWIITDADEASMICATVTEEAEDGIPMRTDASIKSEIVENISTGDQVIVISQVKKFTNIMTYDGITGYVKTAQLSEATQLPAIDSGYMEPEYTSLSLGKNVRLIWHQTLGGDTGLEALPGILERTSGVVNVIAPTFFLISDETGNLDATAATADYVNQAHDAGLQVWAMVDNLNISIDSYALLSSTEARSNLISQLMAQATALGLDGINVDFEALSLECGVHYVQFLRELSIACRNAGLYLSVDNYVPSAYTEFYDRTEQGIICDYVIMMGYDEHYAGSTSGSTASLSFVKTGIEASLEEVPAEKFICAEPFYTRVWNTSDGSSYAIGMSGCADLVTAYADSKVWLEDENQYYLSYEQEGVTYEVWLEDLASQEARLSLIDSYDIGGIAFWKAGLDTEAVWDLIQKY